MTELQQIIKVLTITSSSSDAISSQSDFFENQYNQNPTHPSVKVMFPLTHTKKIIILIYKKYLAITVC